MNEEFENNTPIAPELQVRLMNLVMGEASDFERDQLQVLMEQHPELAAFYAHLQHMHGLLCEAGAGELSFDAELPNEEDSWQLSPDRRDPLLAVLDGKAKAPAANVERTSTFQTVQKSFIARRWLAALAVTAASLLLGLVIYPRMKSTRSTAFARKANEVAGGTSSMWYRASEGLYFNITEPSAATGADAPLPNDKMSSLHADFVPPSASPSASASTQTLPPSVPASPHSGSTVMLSDGTHHESKWSRFGEEDVGASHTSIEKLSDDFFRRGRGDSPGGFGGGAKVENLRELAQNQPQSMGFHDAKGNSSGPDDADGDKTFDGRTEVNARSGQPSTSSGLIFQDLSKATSQTGTAPSQRFFTNKEADFGQTFALAESEVSKWGSSPNSVIPSPMTFSRDGATEQLQTVTAAVEPDLELAASDKPISPPSLPNEERWDDLAMRRSEYFGDAQVQSVDELEAFIVRGSKADVERAQKAIEQFKKQSRADVDESSELVIDSEAKASSLWAGMPLDAIQQSSPRTTESVTLNAQDEYLGRKFQTAPSPEIVAKQFIEPTPEAVALQSATPVTPSEPASGPAKPTNPPVAIDEESAAKEAFSTFSLHVSDVSFKLAQAALGQGQWPEADKIRIEEFVNALDYRDPLPSGNEKVACRVEQAIHPFLMQRNLLRVSMRTAATGRSQSTPLRLTILLDNSGSMERPDRRQAVLRAFQTLGAQLKATDQITLISFANTPRLLADKVQGNQSETLLQIIENLPSEGGTNIEAALMLAREKAAEQQLAGAQNRIVLLTDGAVNLGNANPDSLAKLVTQLRDSGIAFDAAGISAHDLNDEVLETLTRQGDGRYYLLDSAQSADESFAAQIAGALRPSAKNVKVQVEFNPQRVGHYKLLGFEKHRLNTEDFRNDQVDAAELAAAEAGVAVYQYEIKPNGSGDVGNVSVRFRDVSTGKMIEHRWPIPYESNTPRLEQAAPSMQLATCAALFAAKLGGGPIADTVDLAKLQKLLSSLPDHVASQPRVQQMRSMLEQAINIAH